MCTIDCAVQLQKETCGCIAEELIYHACKSYGYEYTPIQGIDFT